MAGPVPEHLDAPMEPRRLGVQLRSRHSLNNPAVIAAPVVAPVVPDHLESGTGRDSVCIAKRSCQPQRLLPLVGPVQYREIECQCHESDVHTEDKILAEVRSGEGSLKFLPQILGSDERCD